MMLDDEFVRTQISYAAFLMGTLTFMPGILALVPNFSLKLVGFAGLAYCLLTLVISIAAFVVPREDMVERGKKRGMNGMYRSISGIVLYGAIIYVAR